MHPDTDEVLECSRRIKEYCSIYHYSPHKCIFCKYSNTSKYGTEMLLCTHYNGICRGDWRKIMDERKCKLKDLFN